MKHFLVLGMLLVGSFLAPPESNEVLADETNNNELNANKVFVSSNENVVLEEGKIFILENGVTITASEIEEKSITSNDLIGINATPPNGVWDYIGSSTFKKESSIFHSTGGDVLIDIYLNPVPSALGSPYVIQLREKDTYLSSLVAQIEIKKSSSWKVSVRGWNDGDNNLSELFLRKLSYTGNYTESDWYD